MPISLKFPANLVKNEPEISTLALIIPDYSCTYWDNALVVLYDEHFSGRLPNNLSPVYDYRQILHTLKSRNHVSSTGKDWYGDSEKQSKEYDTCSRKSSSYGCAKVYTSHEYAVIEQPALFTLPGGILVECCSGTLPKQNSYKLSVWVRNESEHDITLPSHCIIAELHTPEIIRDNLSVSNEDVATLKCCSVSPQPVHEDGTSSLTFDFGISHLSEEWMNRVKQSLTAYMDVFA